MIPNPTTTGMSLKNLVKYTCNNISRSLFLIDTVPLSTGLMRGEKPLNKIFTEVGQGGVEG